MPIATAERGFTLVEMLVVILLIGLMLGVGLAIDFGGSPQRLTRQGEIFANELTLAAEEAVLDGMVWGLDFFSAPDGRSGYRWLRLEEVSWQPIAIPGSDTTEALFVEGSVVELFLDGQHHQPEARVELEGLSEERVFMPEVLLLPTRELDPFVLSLNTGDGEPLVLSADLFGRVRVNEDAPTPP